MPIGTPVGNLDIANATLRTSNLETQNIKIGSIFVGTGNSLEETANVGNSMSNTIQFTNTHTAFTTTGNVTVGKELTVTGNVTVSKDLTVTEDLSVGTNTFHVDTTNNRVGIGTDTPGAQLEVVEGTTAAPLTTETTVMQLNSTISGSTSDHACYFKFQHVPESSPVDWTDWSGRLQFVTGTTNQGYMEFNPSGSEYGIAFGNTGGGSAAGEIMRLLGTGQVGIGYENPSDKLEVNGNIRANHLNLDGTQLVNNVQISATAGTWHELADTSALSSGLYIFQVTWGNAYDNTTRIWSGGTSFDLYVRAGISGIYNASPFETISHNPVYHYRTVSGYLFGHDSNSVNGNYGQQTIYIQSPQSSLTIDGLSVTAYKIG